MKTSFTTSDSKMNNQNTNTLVQENATLSSTTNKPVFSTVDLWNIQRMKRVRTPRKLLS